MQQPALLDIKATEMHRQKRRIATIVCAGELFACCGNTPLISTRAPLVLGYFAGHAALEASRYMIEVI